MTINSEVVRINQHATFHFFFLGGGEEEPQAVGVSNDVKKKMWIGYETC